MAIVMFFLGKNVQAAGFDPMTGLPVPDAAPKMISLPTTSQNLTLFKASNIIKLSVPSFKQEYANSCEPSALRMVLAYYGITASDFEVLEKIGYAPRFKDLAKNEWDDPQKQFVGYVDNVGGGYGVYGQPVAAAAEKFGRTTEYRTFITPQFLAKEISLGNPIIIWGSTSITAEPYAWNLPSGGQARAFKGEHARVVVGVKGSILNPAGFYVHDPINGKSFEYWTTTKMVEQLYGVMGITNQAVVVR